VTDGLDRLSAVAHGRVEAGKLVEVAAHVDVQAGAQGTLELAEATALVRLDPVDNLRIDAGYDAWTSVDYLLTAGRDPAITRFAARSQALIGSPIQADEIDNTLYQMGSLSTTWMPPVGPDRLTRLRLNANARYRGHALLERQYARAGVEAGVVGTAGGRLDLGVGEALLSWGGKPATETSAWAWLALDPEGMIALDTRMDLIMQPLEGDPRPAPTVYGDMFLDWMASRSWMLSGGYSVSVGRDLERWDVWHGAMLQISWRYDSRHNARDRGLGMGDEQH
jgi:hypothetical protein